MIKYLNGRLQYVSALIKFTEESSNEETSKVLVILRQSDFYKVIFAGI